MSAPRATPVVIRRAARGDLPRAHQLEREEFSVYVLSERQLRYLQQRSSVVFLVAEKEGRVVGHGIALVRRHERCRSGRVYDLVVESVHRGQKIGHLLLRSLLDELASRDVRRIYLEVDEANTRAIRLYERFGFRRVGELPDYYSPGKHGIRMMHELAAR